MPSTRELERLTLKIVKVLKAHGIKKAGIFGSYAKGEQKKKSDVDILVEPRRGMGLEFVGMALELEQVLDRKVDLVTYRSLHPYLKESILSDEVRIL